MALGGTLSGAVFLLWDLQVGEPRSLGGVGAGLWSGVCLLGFKYDSGELLLP